MQKNLQQISEQSSLLKDTEFDPTGLILEFNDQYVRVMNSLMEKTPSTDLAQFSLRIGTLFAKAAIGNSADVSHLFQTQMTALSKYAALGEYIVKKAQGEQIVPVVKPQSDDSRFKDEEWNSNLWFDTLKQSYLIGAEYLQGVFAPTDNLTGQEERKLKFYTDQIVDSMSPTNFALTNPEVIKATQESKGRNLVQGLRNFAQDIEAGRGVKMVDGDAFELGRNIACAPGKVVARNTMAELIQYSPSTEQVKERPVMIVPPWINKYYILDLSPKNSFIGWLVAQGYTVFVISWVNPDESYMDTTFDDYLKDGPLWAMNVIHAISGQDKINAIGYCLGGTLLATLLGFLASQQEAPVSISSATFFTTMIDFSEPGDLGVFVDEESVSQLEEKMAKTGYLEGKSMASTFNMMRANDLIWHFVINNYLLGNPPGQFDLLYWNSDSTRLPANMHSYYLRKMYLENQLVETNGIEVLGTPVDLSKVEVPSLFVSTQMDHIAPWESTYSGARLFPGKVRFILGQSGHIAGIINPPSRNKYGYWTSTGELPETAEQWLDTATRKEGSWWPEWEKWVKRYSGKKIPSREPGNEEHQPLAEAPGTYVRL